MKSEHGVVAKYRRLVAKGQITQEQATQSLRTYGCSLAIGRGFGETMEDFAARKPQVGQFYADRKVAFGF